MRAIAVAIVIAYHAFPSVAPGGFVGVDVFFVISGYLISSVILRELSEGDFTIARFYARRIRRIFPALVLVLAVCLGFGWLVLLPIEYDQLGQHVAGGGAFAVNLLLWREAGYFDVIAEVKPLLHLWSLGIEEQFYVAWPLLLALGHRMRRSPLVLIVPLLALSFGLDLYLVRSHPIATFYSPMTRLWELATGSVLACSRTPGAALTRRGVATGFGLVLIAASVAVIDTGRAFPGAWAVLPVVGTSLVIAAGPDTWLARKVLANRALVWLGLISYPLYLWHWPALAFMRILSSGTPTVKLRILAVVGSVVAAWVTYRWIERPIRQGRGKRKAVVLVVLVVAMVAIVSAGLGIHAAQGVPSRMPEPLRAIASSDYDYTADARLDRCWIAAADAADGFAPECVDPPSSRPLVLVWGDSHAARLYPGLRAIADASGFRLAQFTRASCAPILDGPVGACNPGNDYVLGRVRSIKPDVVILFASWRQHSTSWEHDDPVVTKLLHTVTAILDAGVRRVLVVGTAPEWRDTLPRIVLNASWRDPSHELPTRTRHGLNPLIAHVEKAMTENVATALPDGAAYVSAWQIFCNDTGCLTHVDGGLVAWDYAHLTTPGALYLAQRLPILR